MAAPAIRPNFLAEELDRVTVVAGMKIGRRIVENAALAPYIALRNESRPAVSDR